MLADSIKKILAHDGRLLNKVIVTFFVRAFSAVIAFLINVLIARYLGVEEAGIYFLSFTLITGLTVFVRFGLDNALIRFVSPAWERGDVSKVVSISLQGFCIVALIGGVTTAVVYNSSNLLALHVFNEVRLTNTLEQMSLALLPFSLVWGVGGILKAVDQPAKANFIEAGAIPLFVGVVLSVLIFNAQNISSVTVAVAFLIATVVAFVIGVIFFIKPIKVIGKLKLNSIGNLFSSAYPFLLVGMLNYLIIWSPTIFLGIYADAEAVGLYNVAHRTAMLISFILIVFNSITAPRFADYYNSGKIRELERLAAKTALLTSLAASPLLLAVVFFSESILMTFGEGFTSASMLLIVIAIGQYVNVITGSVGYVLMMTGHEKYIRNNLIIISVLSITLNMVLIKQYGALGAAITTSICLIVQNIISSVIVYRKLGIMIFPRLIATNKP